MAAPTLAARSTSGLEFFSLGENEHQAQQVESNCRLVSFSQDGTRLAVCNGQTTKILSFAGSELKEYCQLDHRRTSCCIFSPRGHCVALYQPYVVSKDIPEGTPNMSVYDLRSDAPRLLKAWVQKKQAEWCPQWNEDETVCAKQQGSTVNFFEGTNLDVPAHRLHLDQLKAFSIAPHGQHVACSAAGGKDQPSTVRIFMYPGLERPIASKSFFQADRIDMMWNCRATGLIISCSTETSADSYYGDTSLHYLGTDGEGFSVSLDKKGPVYHAEWSPNGREFCVIYGHMPAKAVLFNTHCEPVFQFGTGPRNIAHFNPHGSLLAIAGFGNLRGSIEVWDVTRKSLVTRVDAPDTTHFMWSPDGERFVTATTTPRLRVGNGFKIWNYRGECQHKQDYCEKGQELWEVTWQPGSYPPPKLTYVPIDAVKAQEKKVEAYRPPGLRGKESTFKLHDDEELPENAKKQEDLSKNALRNRKKRQAKKTKQITDGPNEEPEEQHKPEEPSPTSGDPEKDKRVRNLRKKLQQIEQLEEKQRNGVPLELNQLEKLKNKAPLIEELESLSL